MKSNSISFFISSKIGLHTAVPYVLELEDRGLHIHLYISDDINCIELKRNGIKSNYSYISNIKKLYIHEFIHRAIILFFTPLDYSLNFNRWLKQRLTQRNFYIQKLVYFLRLLAFKIKREKINNLIYRILSPFTPNLFVYSKIIVVTLPIKSHFLCSKQLNVYTILESWDQIYRSPVGYKSEKVFMWNKSLSNDWEKVQGTTKTYEAYPIKLKYAHNRQVKDPQIIKKILYAPMTSSSSYKKMYLEEIKFIELLCKITEKLEIDLLIKPKPNTKIGDLDYFLKFNNVSIGSYQDNDSGSSYSLSNEYNDIRRNEINKCDILINIGTTFCLDCAFYGLPILQIKVNHSSFPVISNLGSHTTRYINSKENFIFTLDDSENLYDALSNILTSNTNLARAKGLRDSLREWIMPKEEYRDAICKVVDEILVSD